jgi:hypothetical protein
MFALEILLPEVSNRTFLPVVIATGAATQIGRMLIGQDPAFAVPEIQFRSPIRSAWRRASPSCCSARSAASRPMRSSACWW